MISRHGLVAKNLYLAVCQGVLFPINQPSNQGARNPGGTKNTFEKMEGGRHVRNRVVNPLPLDLLDLRFLPFVCPVLPCT